MKESYDFSKGKRGRIAPAPQGKTRITIRIDDEVMDYFLKEADKAGGAVDHETLINDALRRFIREEPLGLNRATLSQVSNDELRPEMGSVNMAEEKQWIIQRCTQKWNRRPELGAAGFELLYENFPTPEGLMTRAQMAEVLERVSREHPDSEFRGHKVCLTL